MRSPTTGSSRSTIPRSTPSSPRRSRTISISARRPSACGSRSRTSWWSARSSLPQVGAQLGGNVTRDKDQTSNYYSTLAYAGVAWELDLWGRLRAQRAAAEAGFEATALDYAYARQSLAALVAKTWYLAIETRQLVALGERAVKVYEDLLALVNVRRSAGKDSDLDVVDVRAKLETAQSQLEQAREAYGEARRILEVLLGRYPAAELEVASAYPQLPPLAGAGVPASLLERRPDIIAAERAVLAAFRQQEAATLALLPDFSISLVGGRLGDQILSLLRLNPWLASAGIGVSIPIYEGGALRAQVEIATAQQAQAVARYGAVALAAFREAEDALANEQLLLKRLPFEQRALTDRTAAVQHRYRAVQGGPPGPAVGGAVADGAARHCSDAHQAAQRPGRESNPAVPCAGWQF